MQLYPNRKVTRSTNDNGIPTLKVHSYTKLQLLYLNLVFFPIISPVLGYFAAKRNVSDYLNDIIDIEVDGIDNSDYPDHVDAYISRAVWNSSLTELTESQLDRLNDKHSDFVYEAVQNHLY